MIATNATGRCLFPSTLQPTAADLESAAMAWLSNSHLALEPRLLVAFRAMTQPLDQAAAAVPEQKFRARGGLTRNSPEA